MEMDLVSKRKQDNIQQEDRRKHCVSVRLNDTELKLLDGARGRHQKGEALRMLSFQHLPSPVPEINQKAWVELSRVSANLNQLAQHYNQYPAERKDAELLQSLLTDFRKKLIGA